MDIALRPRPTGSLERRLVPPLRESGVHQVPGREVSRLPRGPLWNRLGLLGPVVCVEPGARLGTVDHGVAGGDSRSGRTPRLWLHLLHLAMLSLCSCGRRKLRGLHGLSNAGLGWRGGGKDVDHGESDE